MTTMTHSAVPTRPCSTCGTNRVTAPKRVCDQCTRLRRQRNDSNRYRDRYEKGICQKCPNRRLPDHTICQDCLETRRQAHREQYQEWLEAGLCTRCGEPAEPGYKTCAKHHAGRETAPRRPTVRLTVADPATAEATGDLKLVTLESMKERSDNVYCINTHGTFGQYPMQLTRNNIRRLIRFLEANSHERLYAIEEPSTGSAGRPESPTGATS